MMTVELEYTSRIEQIWGSIFSAEQAPKTFKKNPDSVKKIENQGLCDVPDLGETSPGPQDPGVPSLP